MGFTGSLVLTRTLVSLTDLDPVASYDAELVGRRDHDWQLAAVIGRAQGTSVWAAALVNATTAPVLIAVVDDSDTALLADSPGGHRWFAGLTAPNNTSTGTTAAPSDAVVVAIAGLAVAWAAEAGQSVDTEAVAEALCAADPDNRAAGQAMTEIMRNQISFIEISVMRVLAVPGQDAGSRWAYLGSKANTHFP